MLTWSIRSVSCDLYGHMRCMLSNYPVLSNAAVCWPSGDSAVLEKYLKYLEVFELTQIIRRRSSMCVRLSSQGFCSTVCTPPSATRAAYRWRWRARQMLIMCPRGGFTCSSWCVKRSSSASPCVSSCWKVEQTPVRQTRSETKRKQRWKDLSILSPPPSSLFIFPTFSSQLTGVTALMEAAKAGSLQLVRAILKKGGNPNAVDHKRYAAVHYAALGGYFEVQYLLEFGSMNWSMYTL